MTSTSGGLFGGGSTTATTTSNATPAGLFGGTRTTANAASNTTPTGLQFGGTRTTTPAVSAPFGSTAPTGHFGASTQAGQTASGSLFATPIISSSRRAEPPADHKPILQGLEKLFSSGEYSDLKITCGEASWDVHRMIVCSASDFFKKCCTNFKEAQTGVIDLPDDDRHTVDALLRYLYTANYDDNIAIDDAAPVLFNVQVHTIADKYNIPGLCKLAEAKFLWRAEVGWKTDSFAEAVLEMYETSPESKKTMQNSAVKLAIEHAEDLFKDRQSKFQEIAQKVAPFSYEISFQLMAAHLAKPKVNDGDRQCPYCRRTIKPSSVLGQPTMLKCPECRNTFGSSTATV